MFMAFFEIIVALFGLMHGIFWVWPVGNPGLICDKRQLAVWSELVILHEISKKPSHSIFGKDFVNKEWVEKERDNFGLSVLILVSSAPSSFGQNATIMELFKTSFFRFFFHNACNVTFSEFNFDNLT